eukprot:3310541-Rhodomonas_salina.2
MGWRKTGNEGLVSSNATQNTTQCKAGPEELVVRKNPEHRNTIHVGSLEDTTRGRSEQVPYFLLDYKSRSSRIRERLASDSEREPPSDALAPFHYITCPADSCPNPAPRWPFTSVDSEGAVRRPLIGFGLHG